MTTTTPTPLQAAHDERNRKLAEAQEDYAKTVQQANVEYADAIRSAASETSMSQVARDLNITRQTLHDIVKKHPAAA